MSTEQKILVVEDDPLIGADIVSTLTGYGYTVAGPIASGEKVLKDIQKIKPNFILMDIALSGKLDGVQTAEELQKTFPVPVVFLSALNDEATLQRAKLVNPFGYIIKPFDGPELRSAIELTLHRFANEPHSDSVHEIADSHFNINELNPSAVDSSEQIYNFLSNLPVFNGVTATAIQKLSKYCKIREFDAGEFLTYEGEKTEGVFIPLTGRISITKTSVSGKELIVALLAPGDIFGLFYSLPAFTESTSAKTKIVSKAIWIHMSAWNNFVEEAPVIFKNLTIEIAERLSDSHTLCSSLAHARVEGRIISTLIALLSNFGRSTGNNSKESRIFITRKELAELTGTTSETSIRVTKNLERAGLLDLTKPGIIKIPNIDSLKTMLYVD